MEKIKKITLYLICLSIILLLVKYLNIIHILKKILILFIPLFIGLFYSWLSNPLIRKLSKKYPHNLICTILFIIIILSITSFICLLIPTIYREIKELYLMIPNITNKLELLFNKFGCTNYLDRLSSYLLDNLPKYIVDIGGKTVEYTGTFIVGLILGLYLSFDYEKIISFLNKIFNSKENIWNLLLQISNGVRKTIKGTLTVAFFVFILDTICFTILKLDASILLGILCGITDLIPYIGPYLGGALAVCIGFTESKSLGILTLICCISVQTIENYIFQPLIMSKSIKISPSLIIISLLIFGKLFGIIGMIIASPIVVTIKIILNYLTNSSKISIDK